METVRACCEVISSRTLESEVSVSEGTPVLSRDRERFTAQESETTGPFSFSLSVHLQGAKHTPVNHWVKGKKAASS